MGRSLWQNLSPLGRVITLSLALPLLLLNAWAVVLIIHTFAGLLRILISSSLLAFILNYPVDFMVRRGASRGRAATLIFLLTLTLLATLGFVLVPLALGQAHQLLLHLPGWFAGAWEALLHWDISLNRLLTGFGVALDLRQLGAQVAAQLQNQAQGLTQQILGLAVVTLGGLVDGLFTLVLTFYLLQHGQLLWQGLIRWLPAATRQALTQALRLSFQNYFVGQGIMAGSIALVLAPTFWLLQIPYALLFALLIGLMALIPFGTTVGIALVTAVVTILDISLGLRVLVSGLLIQQVLENLVAPRVLGKVTGLNPFWVLVAVLLGVQTAGLLGVIMAVPLASLLKTGLAAWEAQTSP